MSTYDTYSSPLASRNASQEMLRLWSPRHKFNTWRRIWLAVAEAQHEMGLPVTKEQVEELRGVVNRPGGITDEEMKAAEKYERELRHDVMAHVHALGDSCPKAKGIIHLGMTSQDVVCNADLLTLRQTTAIVVTKSIRVVLALAECAARLIDVPSLGFTHYQPAQPVTVGRRFANWAYECWLASERVRHFSSELRLRGFRGATGTQAAFVAVASNRRPSTTSLEPWLAKHSQWTATLNDEELAETTKYLYEMRTRRLLRALARTSSLHQLTQFSTPESLFTIVGWDRKYPKPTLDAWASPLRRFIEWVGKNDTNQAVSDVSASTWEALEDLVGEKLGFDGDFFELTTQTYPRVIDTFILADLASCAAVLHKIATDIRLLSNRKEIDEPFEDKQIGSSAMPYKRNPMRCERICGLTRFVMNLVGNAYDTAATQWLERTLDDSSNRRLSLPEAFLALDGALDLMHNVASGLIVHEAMVRKNLMAELPFMATENILMACVKAGGDRQHYHELIRQHSQAAGLRVKQEGLDNDLLERLKGDRNFWSTSRGGPLSAELDWDGVMDPMKYVGRSVEQTERFIKDVVEPLREQYGEAIAKLGESAPKV